jgi:DNA polymerase-3 subunit beta
MEITIPKDELAKLLHITLAIAEKKSTMPIYGNLLLTANDGTLQITATDAEVTAVASAKAKVKVKGAITISAKMLGELVRELPEGDVTINVGERARVEVIAGNSNLKIVGVSAEEYPVPTGLSLPTKCKISAKTLNEMINKTIYAVSLDEGRYNMNGVCVELVREGKKTALRMVATDGHRLALITRELDGVEFTSLVPKGSKTKDNERDNVIVPRKGLSEVRKALETVGDAQVGVDVIDGFLVVESVNWKLVARLVDSDFPNYEQVLPKAEGVKVAFLSSQMEHALKRVSLVVSDKNKGVRLDFLNNLVRISSSSPEVGEGLDEVEVQYKGRDMSVGFNARYIIDALSTIGENQPFILELSGETGPGKMYAEADESAIGIVMPLRLE